MNWNSFTTTIQYPVHSMVVQYLLKQKRSIIMTMIIIALEVRVHPIPPLQPHPLSPTPQVAVRAAAVTVVPPVCMAAAFLIITMKVDDPIRVLRFHLSV